MMLLIGVDGGGTKTHIALKIDKEKTILFHTKGTNYENIGFNDVKVILRQGMERLLEQAGKEWCDISAVCFGMAGIDYEIDRINFEKEVVRKIPLTGKYCIENDAYVALKAGTASDNGIVINAGTGIKVCGVSGSKEIYSDAVGISSIQHRIIQTLGRELELGIGDGGFAEELFTILNIDDPYNYLRWLFLYNNIRKPACPYSEELIRGYPAAFFEILKNGNSRALKILDLAVDDFASLVLNTAMRLKKPIDDFELILSGSIFMENRDLNFEEMFCRKFRKKGSGALPGKISVLDTPPYEGAVIEAERIWRSND